jgi:cytochrome c peroxidase
MRAGLFLALAIPLGLDLYMPVPEHNTVTLEKVALGQQLFFDTRLSADGSISCGTCHQPALAFGDGGSIAAGVFGRVGRRNAPALINRGYGRAFFWDGRVSSLEEQVLRPIEDPNEMGSSVDAAAARVGISPGELASALASFVRSILSGNSPFDHFMNGDRDALTPDEQAGLQVFRGKAHCVACHVGPNFTDEGLHNTGVAWVNGGFLDAGAGKGDFKTPTLREIARTAPYMHDGSFSSLEAVVEFYDGGGRANPALDPDIRPLRMSPDQKTLLLMFLRTLSGEVQAGTTATTSSQRSAHPGAHRLSSEQSPPTACVLQSSLPGAYMTLRDKLELGIRNDAALRKDNLPDNEVHGPEEPCGSARLGFRGPADPFRGLLSHGARV